ncbi:hypothetical protein ACFWH7_03665 [Cellulosimicrobium cellulans]|uniref:hypothetical protein n=1 Tax=Cellulosimicrobium cellulans TaxID=1710 RepID=UPI00364EC7DD
MKRARTLAAGVVMVSLALSVTACASGGGSSGACMPSSPLVDPETVRAGETVVVTVEGLNAREGCRASLADGATYAVRLASHTEMQAKTEIELGSPSAQGALTAEVEIPADFPEGPVVLDILVDGENLWCELDPAVECGRSNAMIEVVGPEAG